MHIVRKTLLLLSLSFALPLAAEDAAVSVLQSASAASYTAATDKIAQLIGAFSEEQLAWRPSDKVLTTREVILHVAAANYFLSTRIGATLPEGINPRELAGPAASKAELLAVFERSVEFARAATAAVPDSDLDAEMEFFGQKATRLRFMFIFIEHVHEHLGQLIAYARSNDVVPPWSK